MRLDCHIHAVHGPVNRADLKERMQRAGLDGGVIFSQPPNGYYIMDEGGFSLTNEERMENGLEWTGGDPYLFPFYFIDPTDEDAKEQVAKAHEMGYRGFKMMCTHYMPGDPRAMETYWEVAKYNMPVLFHSGILYDGKNDSGNYNRPCNFEALLQVDGLRFALAHISWPWTDEYIAVFGKFNNSLQKGGEAAAGAEMFIDLTPGTPAIYRKEALMRLLYTPYNQMGNIMFGEDSQTIGFRDDYARQLWERDDKIYEELGISKEVQEKIYYHNLMRFLGEPK